MSPWLGIGLVLGALGILLVGLRLYQRAYDPHPELVRKLVHIPMGLTTLSFPWLFEAAWPVAVLAALALAFLWGLRQPGPLHTHLGTVLGGVARQSWGEVYFSVAIALLFWLAQGDPLLFGIPMLVLTLADAVAALVGVRYGQMHYTATDGRKSAEGSITFFTTAFLSTHIPLLLMSETGRGETLLIALIVGLLVMLIEAIAWRGIDNLLIPLGTFVLLQTHLAMPLAGLVGRLVVTVALVVFALLWRSRTTLTDGAILGTVLVGYGSWALGGWPWLLAPLILFISYPLLLAPPPEPLLPEDASADHSPPEPAPSKLPLVLPRARVHNLPAVLSVAGAGAWWLLLFGRWPEAGLLYPYTLAFGANLAMIGVAGLPSADYWRPAVIGQVAIAIGQGWLLLLAPLLGLAWWQQAAGGLLLALGFGGLVGTALAAIAFYLTQPWLRRHPTSWNWVARSGYAILGSSLLLLPLYAW